MYQVSGAGDGSCQQAEEDLPEHLSGDMRLLKVDPWGVYERVKLNGARQIHQGHE